MAVVVFLESRYVRQPAEQIARRLDIGTQGVSAVAIIDTESHLHDKEILIVVAQDGVAIGLVVQIIVLECLTNPRHVDIVEVYKVKTVGDVSPPVVPAIPPSSREYPPVKLRSILQVPS